jgi:hypothetical protein
MTYYLLLKWAAPSQTLRFLCGLALKKVYVLAQNRFGHHKRQALAPAMQSQAKSEAKKNGPHP